MELELGLKITKTSRDDCPSTDLHVKKGRAGPIFLSTETETMFILRVHLQGFQGEMIKIGINEDGSEIEIRGEKPVEDVVVIVGGKLRRNETEIRGFRRILKIPEGVVLDGIKARFNEEATALTIFMPKSVKGLRGVGIEEVLTEAAPKTKSTTKTLQPESTEAQVSSKGETEGAAETPPQVECHRETGGDDAGGEKEDHLAETAEKSEIATEEKMEVEAVKKEPVSTEVSPGKDIGAFNNKEEVSEPGGTKLEDDSRAHDHGQLIQLPSEHSNGETSRAAGKMPQQESQRLENNTNVQKPTTISPNFELEHIKSEEVHGKERSPGIVNGIQAEALVNNGEKNPKESKIDEGESREFDKKGEPSRQVTQTEHTSIKLFMGSAFLVSLVALAFSWIKARKRSKHQ